MRHSPFTLVSPSSVIRLLLDATNTTKARRKNVIEAVRQRDTSIKVIFLESICNDQEILTSNYKMKLSNEDYRGMPEAEALADFAKRVARYEEVYEELDEDEDSGRVNYLKTYDAGRKFHIARSASGYLHTQVVLLTNH
jgi:6-phosphofructo-2-kinase